MCAGVYLPIQLIFVGGGGGGGGGICDRDLKKATNQKKTKTYSYVRDSNLCVVFLELIPLNL